MSTHLGIVTAAGVVHFEGKTAKECRDFLKGYGLECNLMKGWLSEQYMGAIDFRDKKWHALVKPLL